MNNKDSWILVEDSLPEPNKCVLVVCESTCGQGRMYSIASCKNNCWFLQNQELSLSYPHSQWRVIAWTPLTEYKRK